MTTDHLTDELVGTTFTTAQRVRFPISRLVVDPERFLNDADEPMSRVGMGVIYERTSHGHLLRHPPTQSARQRLIETYYVPHHAALEVAVTTALKHGHCTILDMHSFPSRPLPYELDQVRDRPDICLGTDEFHTPEWMADELMQRFSAEGLSVAMNRPFSGALVPLRFFRNDNRVKSVMVEVNRQLYLDEATGKMGAHFSQVQNIVASVLESVRT